MWGVSGCGANVACWKHATIRESRSGVPLARRFTPCIDTPHCATALLSMGLLKLRVFNTPCNTRTQINLKTDYLFNINYQYGNQHSTNKVAEGIGYECGVKGFLEWVFFSMAAEPQILRLNFWWIRYLLIRKASPTMMKAINSQPIGRKAKIPKETSKSKFM